MAFRPVGVGPTPSVGKVLADDAPAVDDGAQPTTEVDPGIWQPKAGAVQRRAPAAAEPVADITPPRINEVCERLLLEGVRKPGKLITLAEGDPQKPLALSIHGIRGNPENVQPFIDDSARAGQTTTTFIYDDDYRRLTKSANELSKQLGKWVDENPGRSIEISAHSMGSRVVLAALGKLDQQGKLTMPVELRMVAPPLGGYGSANMAVLAPKFIGEHIRGVEPGKDMGTWSRFQRDLEAVHLPANVNVTVFTASNDSVVDYSGERFGRIAQNLNARRVMLPGTDHDSAVAAAAQRVRDFSR